MTRVREEQVGGAGQLQGHVRALKVMERKHKQTTTRSCQVKLKDDKCRVNAFGRLALAGMGRNAACVCIHVSCHIVHGTVAFVERIREMGRGATMCASRVRAVCGLRVKSQRTRSNDEVCTKAIKQLQRLSLQHSPSKSSSSYTSQSISSPFYQTYNRLTPRFHAYAHIQAIRSQQKEIKIQKSTKWRGDNRVHRIENRPPDTGQ
jgi:hypothetical protein